MSSTIRLFRIWGIPIGLHWSWFLVFALVTWSLAAGYFPEEYPSLSKPDHWLLGALTSVLFFTSVLIHELGHTYVALRNKVPVREITLFIFGGAAHMSEETRSPGAEFRVSIAGPLTSLALAAIFWGLWLIDQDVALLAAPSIWLARINLMLALFNLIPGFPLDGGRVFRAVVWWFTGSLKKATRAAVFTGQLVAFGFIGWGVLTIITGNLFNGLWLAFIGWFLQNAATASGAQSDLQQLLGNVKVSQVMSTDCPRVPSLLPLDRLVEEQVLTGGQRYFCVVDNGSLRGMLTLREVTGVPRMSWQQVTAEQAMVPLERLVRVGSDDDLMSALRAMDDAGVVEVPVIDGSRFVGIISREQVLHYIRVRTELGV